MVDPKSVSEVRKRFMLQGIEALKQTAQYQAEAITEQADPIQPIVNRNVKPADPENPEAPTGWDGDLFNLEGISQAFSRDELDEDFLKVIDPANPGVIGDLVSISLQGDWLATMERAFRARHQTPVRAWMHAAGRRKGHGHNAGVINQGLLRYVENLLQAAKNKQATP